MAQCGLHVPGNGIHSAHLLHHSLLSCRGPLDVRSDEQANSLPTACTPKQRPPLLVTGDREGPRSRTGARICARRASLKMSGGGGHAGGVFGGEGGIGSRRTCSPQRFTPDRNRRIRENPRKLISSTKQGQRNSTPLSLKNEESATPHFRSTSAYRDLSLHARRTPGLLGASPTELGQPEGYRERDCPPRLLP